MARYEFQDNTIQLITMYQQRGIYPGNNNVASFVKQTFVSKNSKKKNKTLDLNKHKSDG